jgi:hypothetical protein
MEVMVAVQSGTLLRALGVQLKRRVSARRGGDYNEVPQKFPLAAAIAVYSTPALRIQINISAAGADGSGSACLSLSWVCQYYLLVIT